jgi:hypothetical protein
VEKTLPVMSMIPQCLTLTTRNEIKNVSVSIATLKMAMKIVL